MGGENQSKFKMKKNQSVSNKSKEEALTWACNYFKEMLEEWYVEQYVYEVDQVEKLIKMYYDLIDVHKDSWMYLCFIGDEIIELKSVIQKCLDRKWTIIKKDLCEELEWAVHLNTLQLLLAEVYAHKQKEKPASVIKSVQSPSNQESKILKESEDIISDKKDMKTISDPKPDEPSAGTKKPPKVRYMGSVGDIMATLKKHGALSTFRLKELMAQDLNFKPSDNHLKGLLQVAQDRGKIKLDEESQKWMLP